MSTEKRFQMSEKGRQFLEIIRTNLHRQLEQLWKRLPGTSDEKADQVISFVNKFFKPLLLRTVPVEIAQGQEGEEIDRVIVAHVEKVAKEFIDVKKGHHGEPSKLILPFFGMDN